MVNELKTGFQWTPVDFYSAKQASAFDNEGGRAITLGFGLTSASNGNAPNLRNTPSINVEESLNWLKGSHSFRFGGSYTTITNESEQWQLAPTAVIGFTSASDPAESMFTTANFPGASGGQLNDARQLYALHDRPHQRGQCDLAVERVNRRV